MTSNASMKEQMQQNENLIDILASIWKWRKKIILISLVAGIGTAIISLMLPNWYQATTIFYAASPDLAKPQPVGISERDIDFYGQDTDLDRLFSIAKSNELIDYLIDEFDLYTHYEIDPQHEKGPHKLRLKLDKLYNSQKNKFDALELSFEDKDKELAAKVANAARIKINAIAQNLIKRSQGKLLESYKKNVTEKESNLKTLSDEITSLRKKYKIYSISAQGEAYASSMTKVSARLEGLKAKYNAFKSAGIQDSLAKTSAKLKGVESQYAQLKSDVSLFNEGYTIVLNKELEQKDMVEQLSLDKERAKQLNASFNTEFASLHVVQEAEVPVNKSRPKRSIYVIAATMLAFFLTTLWVVFMQQYKSLGWSKIFDA